jgi:predicted RNase H-like HicB family nuclease
MIIEITLPAGTITVPITLTQSGGWVYSSCKVLDVHSQGRGEAEATANLKEAIQLFFETISAQRDGTRFDLSDFTGIVDTVQA